MLCFKTIKVGARNSPLSKVQLLEVQREITRIYPHIYFEPVYVETIGDKDKKTSLRTLEKTDFFTKEIDEMQLKGGCRLTIHSAKDLPEPLPKGLVLAALTKGVDPSDSLVIRQDERLGSSPLIATSSFRREEMVKKIIPHARFTDIRGTIGERLEKLSCNQVDGVVIAEAALIRLGWTHLNRKPLPGQTAALQGRLAILAREGDQEMLELCKGL